MHITSLHHYLDKLKKISNKIYYFLKGKLISQAIVKMMGDN